MNVPRAFLFSLLCAGLANAQGSLQTIVNPQGGKIVYGPIEGQTSEAGAMGAVLRSIHQQFGERPQVGKPFQVRGTHSVAVFFMVSRRALGKGPLAGLLIASNAGSDHMEVAVMSDDAPRFGSTINPMVKTLQGVWNPGRAARAEPSAPVQRSDAAPAARLRPYTLPDNSASVGLPDGWKVLPGSGGGTLLAEGPNGESAQLGFGLMAMNSNDPQVQQTQRWAQQGGGRNTSYAQAIYYPYGRDLGKTFVDFAQILHQRANQPPAIFQMESETPIPTQGRERCAHLVGQVDEKEGKGMKEMNAVFCSAPPVIGGGYMTSGSSTTVPLKFADKERATMAAILASFNQNGAVVQAQANAIAKPAIDAIHEIGRRSAQQAADADAARIQSRQSYERRSDSQARSSQEFSNYLLDQTVIEDREQNAHGTVWNQTADSLVRNNPERYGYVDKPNFWQGIDY